jgi:hypothetical protein
MIFRTPNEIIHTRNSRRDTVFGWNSISRESGGDLVNVFEAEARLDIFIESKLVFSMHL